MVVKTKVRKKVIPLTVYVTADQIEEAYRKLATGTEKDWMEDPEIVKLVEREAKKVEKHYKEGKLRPIEKLWKELGV